MMTTASIDELTVNPSPVSAAVVPRDHWRYLWDVRRFSPSTSDAAAGKKDEEDSESWMPDDPLLPCSESLSIGVSTGSDDEIDQLQEFLADCYVEDDTFRFAYSSDFLRWALCGPRSDPSNLHIRIVENDTGKLVGFLSATPLPLIVRLDQEEEEDKTSTTYASALIDFVCVARPYRGNGLCKFLYGEAIRRCRMIHGIEHLICTSGDHLPAPVSDPTYHHLTLDHDIAARTGFLVVPKGWSEERFHSLCRHRKQELRQYLSHHKESRMNRKSKKGSPMGSLSLVPLTEDRVTESRRLLNDALDRYSLSTTFEDDASFAHQFLPREGIVVTLVRIVTEEDENTTENDKQKVDDEENYSRQEPNEGTIGTSGNRNNAAITELVSFYIIQSRHLSSNLHLRIAYLTHYVVAAVEDDDEDHHGDGEDEEERRRRGFAGLILEAAEYLMEREGIHVINALPVMGTKAEDLRSIRFWEGTGTLYHYLYNIPRLASVPPEGIAVFPGV